jgi:hypothetical protein
MKECQLLSKQVDWPCEVVEIFSKKNLGCKIRISSGIDAVFEKEEMAIILEDDCLPDLSFFKYSEELLLKYRDNDKIKMVAGGNIAEKSFTSDSYFFAQFGGVWGWATWRRAWQKYDVKMNKFNLDEKIGRIQNKEEKKQRYRMWRDVYEGRIDTWDVQWDFMMYQENALAIVPSRNMIKNLGFGPEATHTQDLNDPNSKLVAVETQFPLVHPKDIIIDELYAKFYALKVFKYNAWIDFKYIIKRLIKWRK